MLGVPMGYTSNIFLLLKSGQFLTGIFLFILHVITKRRNKAL